MWRRREQEQIWARFRETTAKLITRNLFSAATETMRFIHDDEIPARRHQILEAVFVELRDLLSGPAFARFQRLHRVHRANDLIESPPHVVARRNAPVGTEIARGVVPELLAEVRLHFRDPLRHESLRREHKDAAHEAAQLKFPHDQSRFDGLAETHLVGQQHTNAILRGCPAQRPELVWQGNDCGPNRCEKDVIVQQVRDARPIKCEANLLRRRRAGFV